MTHVLKGKVLKYQCFKNYQRNYFFYIYNEYKIYVSVELHVIKINNSYILSLHCEYCYINIKSNSNYGFNTSYLKLLNPVCLCNPYILFTWKLIFCLLTIYLLFNLFHAHIHNNMHFPPTAKKPLGQ